ncbi:MAG TPA: uracil-DNA glycosylase family protein [Caulobacteraceae bacterium]|jgi:uracil-DNA glycosylase|nr:uracil-DNA glycosylase family protein [Caulobacteraceae bacterium]
MPLDPLLAEIRACRVCADVLPFEPRPVVWVAAQTRILISSQAPGRLVHERGRPFDDPSGDRLRGWMGVDRATFYGDPRIGVAGMSFCYPGTDPNGADYPPLPRCAPLWRERLLAELPNVELTLLVGSYALDWTLGKSAKRSMTDTVRGWREFPSGVLPLPHPSWRNTAWLRRNPWFDEELAPLVRQRVAEILAG